MSITPTVKTSTEYRRGKHEVSFRADPGEGEICIFPFTLSNQAEVEEYIDALRKAAIEAKLPPTGEKKA